MTKVTINASKLSRAADEAFRETCFLLGAELTKVISEPGAFDGFPGDIVDTGQLRASQDLQFVGGSEARFSWSTDYALYVHEGYTLRNGRSQPGRPWTKLANQRLDSQKVFQTLLREKLK